MNITFILKKKIKLGELNERFKSITLKISIVSVFGKPNIVFLSCLYFSNSIIFIPSLLNIAPSFSAIPMILAILSDVLISKKIKFGELNE